MRPYIFITVIHFGNPIQSLKDSESVTNVIRDLRFANLFSIVCSFDSLVSLFSFLIHSSILLNSFTFGRLPSIHMALIVLKLRSFQFVLPFSPVRLYPHRNHIYIYNNITHRATYIYNYTLVCVTALVHSFIFIFLKTLAQFEKDGWVYHHSILE